ncbi:16S rRNA (guanine(527)-N(7))-methyltransferase RsmG [Aminicella lysinilytica]|uniref:16S rRNA (guanine(527)-N(7))-methyltransferase RsmG n=1 Tax=Aminicella lysinilytica TaxID=433323 RepID=UPI001794259A|nr:16S rRNA (guanine(527)-N(7))-methyltransferase RsmG [Aminicella lysinilytica]NLD11467.1 16S rRNA (guanine(527)-N(7))-methyltransferase RsmG [Clostridiales bacterium]
MSRFLEDLFGELGIDCTEEQYDAFDGYMKGVLEFNKAVNLTAIREPEEFQIKHFADSVLVRNCGEYRSAGRILDLGTGGGFPGVPLAILDPDKEFVLVDSLLKRLKIINELTGKLGISNVNTIHGRAEDLGRKPELRESFDLCVSRAVADLSVLAEYAIPFVKVGGYFIAYKGSDCETEVRNADKAIRTLGGEILRIDKADQTGMEHSLIIIKKIKGTAGKYPRSAGKPSKSPIK